MANASSRSLMRRDNTVTRSKKVEGSLTGVEVVKGNHHGARQGLFSELPRHLHHRSAKARTGEQALRSGVLLRGGQDHPWRPVRLQQRQRLLEQESTDTATAMLECDDEVMKHSGRAAKRHVVDP